MSAESKIGLIVRRPDNLQDTGPASRADVNGEEPVKLFVRMDAGGEIVDSFVIKKLDGETGEYDHRGRLQGPTEYWRQACANARMIFDGRENGRSGVVFQAVDSGGQLNFEPVDNPKQ